MSDRADEFYADLDWPPVEPDSRLETPPAKCVRHRWIRIASDPNSEPVWKCERCPALRDPVKARRGKQSRNYGNRAELAVARTYGGTKIGHAGGPVDVRGAEWNLQVKTHRRLPPAEWRKAFAGMSASGERIPRLLLRFVLGAGQPPDDYFVIRGSDWLTWFGKDEEG